MVRANLPAVFLESSGLCGKRVLQVSAVPTQALPMVSGICGRISMMKAVQKSCTDGKITCMRVGPMESASALNPPSANPGNDPGGQGDQGRREFLVVQEPQRQGRKQLFR